MTLLDIIIAGCYVRETEESKRKTQFSQTASQNGRSLLQGTRLVHAQAHIYGKSMAHSYMNRHTEALTCTYSDTHRYTRRPDAGASEWKTTCLTGVDRWWQTKWTFHISLAVWDRMLGHWNAAKEKGTRFDISANVTLTDSALHQLFLKSHGWTSQLDWSSRHATCKCISPKIPNI